MRNVRQGKINDNSNAVIVNKVNGLNAKALLISGSTLKTIINKVLESGKEFVDDVLPRTEPEVAVNEQTPIISPVYDSNPVVEMANKVVGSIPSQGVLNTSEEIPAVSISFPGAGVTSERVNSTQNLNAPVIPEAPVIQSGVPTPTPVVPTTQNFEVDDSIKIPEIVPPTISISQVGDVVEQPVIAPVNTTQNESLVDLAKEEASVKEAIDMATITPKRETQPILQTPQEFDKEVEKQNISVEVDKVSDAYIVALSDLVTKKEYMEKSLKDLEEVNASQAKAISVLKAQVSELDGVMRNIEEARKSAISKIKGALDNQDKSLYLNSQIQGMGNVR